MSLQSGSVLLLTGPPGCGKTTTILVLAQEMGIQIQEWVNPVMQEFKQDEPAVFDRGKIKKVNPFVNALKILV